MSIYIFYNNDELFRYFVQRIFVMVAEKRFTFSTYLILISFYNNVLNFTMYKRTYEHLKQINDILILSNTLMKGYLKFKMF